MSRTEAAAKKSAALIAEAVANGAEVRRIAEICKAHGVPFNPWFVAKLEGK